MTRRIITDGNGAAALGLKLSRVQVIAAYPITPQSSIAEKLSEYVASGELPAKYVRIESEHSAMSYAVGASITGVRACTATSSVGLALMHEMLGVASGCRLPIVMPVVNRSLVSPWSLWCDHQDSMDERDSGWIQFYCADAQEVLDTVIIAYRVSEDPRVLTPSMVCLDGFFLSHSSEPVELPGQELVDSYLPPYTPTNLKIDLDNPIFLDDLTPPADFTEMKYQQMQGLKAASGVIDEALAEFGRVFGRSYSQVETYLTEDAQAVLVVLGSAWGAACAAADRLREAGHRVGAIRLKVYRPFPYSALRKAVAHVPLIGVAERMANVGVAFGPVTTDVMSALFGRGSNHRVAQFVCGLGGRDVTVATMLKGFMHLLSEDGKGTKEAEWLDVRPDAMTIREVRQDA